jgi:hypothetical protein
VVALTSASYSSPVLPEVAWRDVPLMAARAGLEAPEEQEERATPEVVVQAVAVGWAGTAASAVGMAA